MPRLNHKWALPTQIRRQKLISLIRLTNRLRVEAVFPEEFKDVEVLDDAIRLIQNYNLQPNNHGKCPICNSGEVVEGKIDSVSGAEELKKMEGLCVRYCTNCGAYEIVNL